MTALISSAQSAVRPWSSIDAQTVDDWDIPQQNIDVCLNCELCADKCDNCHRWNATANGRPRKEIDMDLLAEMLSLRKCNKEMCAALGVSKATLQRAKKEI